MTDLRTAQAYLSLLDASGDFTFQTFQDSDRATGSAVYPQVIHGTLEEHGATLNRLNDSGAGIFVMVNAGDGIVKPHARSCRTAANVTRVRALFVDLDGAPVEPVLNSAVLPDFVVQSSPGRWHVYWKVDDCPLTEFTTVQLALADRFDGDRKVADLPHVMRVPGFLHQKEKPFVSRLYLPHQFDSLGDANHD